MNIIKNIFDTTVSFWIDFVQYVSLKFYHITKLEDPYIIVGLTVALTITPITWFLITRFTRNFSWEKLTGIVVIISTSLSGVAKDNLTFAESLAKHSQAAGAMSLVGGVILCIVLILQDPYYSGLFGRFRDED